MPSTCHLVVRFTARPGAEEDLRRVLAALVEPTRAEDGCLRYDLLASADDPAELVFVEEWRDEAALAAHAASEHVARARAQYPELVGAEVDLRLYTLLDTGAAR